MEPTAYIHLVQKLKMSRVVPPLSHTSWPAWGRYSVFVQRQFVALCEWWELQQIICSAKMGHFVMLRELVSSYRAVGG